MQSVLNNTKLYFSFYLMVWLMHLQVCNFLRQRGVEESVVKKFEEEKVSNILVVLYLAPIQGKLCGIWGCIVLS